MLYTLDFVNQVYHTRKICSLISVFANLRVCTYYQRDASHHGVNFLLNKREETMKN